MNIYSYVGANLLEIVILSISAARERRGGRRCAAGAHGVLCRELGFGGAGEGRFFGCATLKASCFFVCFGVGRRGWVLWLCDTGNILFFCLRLGGQWSIFIICFL